jgi:F0F1-type ATP synthase membrane subunit b/b'
MNPIVDTIVMTLFVMILAFLVIGFNRQTLKNYNDKIEARDKRHKEAKKKAEEKIEETETKI